MKSASVLLRIIWGKSLSGVVDVLIDMHSTVCSRISGASVTAHCARVFEPRSTIGDFHFIVSMEFEQCITKGGCW